MNSRWLYPTALW